MRVLGSLYLIPTTLGEQQPHEVLAQNVIKLVEQLTYFVVENEKSARKFIKKAAPHKPQSSLVLSVLNKHTDPAQHREMLQPCLNGHSIGLLSEAGCPAVADPGADLVKIAHEIGVRVVPLVGPSAILLAMMASGLNGQSFAFNGYLPIDKSEKRSALKYWEKVSSEKNQSQIFIETPYRNQKLIEEMTQTLQPNTHLCVATDLTLPSEWIKTNQIAKWKNYKIDIQNRPTIFIIQADVQEKKRR
jgi:16S rRNA (cytidine1402-2'-O)-methyltransferase